MNWAGQLVQKELAPEDVVLDLGCGIMQATLDTANPGRIQCRKIIGLDVYQPYIDRLQALGIDAREWDLRDLPLPFPDKSVDVILLLDVLEHLDWLPQADGILQECERIGRKKVIVLTPSNFDTNIFAATHETGPYNGLGINPKQAHHILITAAWLHRHGFKTRQYPRPTLRRFLRKVLGRLHEPFQYIYAVKPLKLRILHAWSVAGVSSLMAKYQRLLGHDSEVMKSSKVLDRKDLGHDRFYGITFLADSSLRFYQQVIGLSSRYDIIHIHSVYRLAFLLPFKKKILEFHGSDIRQASTITRIAVTILKQLKLPIYVSTPDLQGKWIPNPVDTEHFNRPRDPVPGTALYCWNWYEDKDWAEELAARHGLALTILERGRQNKDFVPYEEFPDYLATFEYFIDRHAIPSLSKTALEALWMGLKVIRWDKKTIMGLDPVHLPENVARKTLQIYYEQLGGSL